MLWWQFLPKQPFNCSLILKLVIITENSHLCAHT